MFFFDFFADEVSQCFVPVESPKAGITLLGDGRHSERRQLLFPVFSSNAGCQSSGMYQGDIKCAAAEIVDQQILIVDGSRFFNDIGQGGGIRFGHE